MSLTSSPLSSAIAIKLQLENSLAQLGEIGECVLLNYPDYANVGDHLIGLGTIIYLLKNSQIKLTYLSAIENHNSQIFDQKLNNNSGNTTILLQGGGNLGDLWYEQQTFREEIIQKYPQHRIIILPQTIYFQAPEKLQQAAQIFNHHPNLTICVRDRHSQQLARTYFSNCQIILAPDMAFMLADLPGLKFFRTNWQQQNHILYHCRDDQEIVSSLNSQVLELFNSGSNPSANLLVNQLPKLVIEDWLPPDNYLHRSHITPESAWYWRLPGVVRIYRQLWQQRLAQSMSWLSRGFWDHDHPYSVMFTNLSATVENTEMLKISWDYLHKSIYQLNRFPFVITNRLHGHILCTLLEIPHIFLPNSYGKNQNWYTTWTQSIPFCRYVDNSSVIIPTIKELCPKFL
ncbi:MAG: polysaccharide polymerase [Coleofasciculaceae cyanobacterium SM2_1_6]|nr:polysaccharide polymerase [Coleofasciculaceae cyanobacterium SM2_1_6]